MTRLNGTFQPVFQKALCRDSHEARGTARPSLLPSALVVVNSHCVQRGLSHGGSVWQGGGWEKEQKCEGVPVCVAKGYVSFSPHLAATSWCYEPGAQPLPVYVHLSLSFCPFLPVSVFVSYLSLCLLVRLLSQAVHPLTSSFRGPASFAFLWFPCYRVCM